MMMVKMMIGDGDDAILAARIWGSGTGFQLLEQKRPDWDLMLYYSRPRLSHKSAN